MKHFPHIRGRGLRLFCVALVILMLTGVLPFCPSVRAASETGSAFSKLASEVDEETLYRDRRVIDDFTEEGLWEGTKFVKTVSTTKYSGNTRCLLATADTDTRRTLGVSRDLSAPVSLDGYSEVMFSFIALGGKDYTYTLETSLYSGDQRYVFVLTLEPNEWYDVFLDVEDIPSFDSVKITATGKGNASKISSIALSSFIMGDRSHVSYAERFSAISVNGGVVTENGIKVTPDASSASVSADAVLSASMGKGVSTVILSVKLSGISQAKMTFSTSSAPLWKSNEFTERSVVSISDSNRLYVTCFAVEGRIVSFSLDFESVVCSSDFLIEEILITPGSGESVDYPLDVTLGSVNRCGFIGEGEDGAVQIGGKITRDAAVDYIDGEICLFTIPPWEEVASALEKEPLAKTSISTEFNFRIPFPSHPSGRAERYIVALRSSDKMECITLPISPSPAQTAAVTVDADTVVCGGESYEVFASGANAAVLDIPLDRLILSSASNDAVLTSFGDSYVYLDRSILSSLSKEIDFHSSCGTEVYFRLLVTNTDIFISAAGRDASGYALDVSTKQNADMLCAAVDYLCSNFSPDAFIIGNGINSLDANCSSLFGDVFAYMRNQSQVVRCVYSIAASYNAQAKVFVPFVAATKAELSQTSGSLPAHLSAVQCAALCDYYTGAYQSLIRWAAVTKVTPSSSDDMTPFQSYMSHSGFLGTSVMLDAQDDGERYAPDAIREEFPRMLSLFVDAKDGNDFTRVITSECEIVPLPYEAKWVSGKVPLWDFTKSFATHSWSLSDHSDPTTQISSELTDVMPFSTCRALHFVLDGSGEHVVAAARIFDDTADLSKCTHVELLLVAQGDGANVSFTVTAGRDEARQIFPVTVKSGESVSVICPLSDSFAPEFIAITGGADGRTVVDVAEVRALSGEYNDSELAAQITQETSVSSDDPEQETVPILFALAAVIGLLSVAIFAFLSRKKR